MATKRADVAPQANERSEHGFTLIELIATIVIMGLVFVPLCAAVNQALNLIPQASTRGDAATDMDRIQEQFAIDTESAQIWQNFAISQTTLDTNTWFPFFADAIPDPGYRPTTPEVGTINCQSSNTALIATKTYHHDATSPTAHNNWEQWQPNFTAINSGTTQVDLQRDEVDTTINPNVSTPWVTYTTAFCKPGDPVLTVTSFAPQPTADGYFKLDFKNLRDIRGNAILPASVYGEIRTSYY
jgi:prepilin-type N-terminal cleavage/methylation domain-containing protein